MLVLETLLRAASDMKLEVPNAREEFSQILSSGDGTWAWDYLAGTVDLICDELRRQDEMSSQKIGPQLIAYVREHYCDSSLSQQQLSSLFHISRSMVSKVFKNTAKVNFIDYLHLLRVQKAKEYFDAGERDVLAVAKKTGYETRLPLSGRSCGWNPSRRGNMFNRSESAEAFLEGAGPNPRTPARAIFVPGGVLVAKSVCVRPEGKDNFGNSFKTVLG